MEDNLFKEAMIEIVNTLANTNEIETRKKYGQIVNKLIKSNYKLEDMDNFNIMINWELEKTLGIVITEINPPIMDMNNLERLKFLYLNYTFMEQNIEKLITKKEGSICCSDKTGHILEAYRQNLLRNIIPERKGSKNYWDVNFGTYEDWFEFCEGLHFLYHGSPEKYFFSYKKLLDTKVER